MVTFGIVPTAAETGYGYIQQGAAADAESTGFHVKAFVEKPDYETAERYLASGDYVWNSGMFLFRASRYLAELEAHRPDILAVCREAMTTTEPDRDFLRVDAARFAACALLRGGESASNAIARLQREPRSSSSSSSTPAGDASPSACVTARSRRRRRWK